MRKVRKSVSFTLVLVLCLGVLTACGGYSSSEDVAEAMLGAYQTYDAKALLELLPVEYLEAYYEEEVTDEEEYLEDLQDVLDEFADLMEEMEGSFSFKVTGKEELSKKQLKALNDSLEDYLEEEIEQAEDVTVEVTFSYTYKKEACEMVSAETFTTFSYGGDWYLDPNSIPRGPYFFLGYHFTPECIVELMLDVMVNYDIEKAELLLPDDVWESFYSSRKETKEEFWANVEEHFREQEQQLEEFDEFKYAFKIDDVDLLDESDTQILNNRMKGYLEHDIEAAAVVVVEVSIEAEYGGEKLDEEAEIDYDVFKYDGKWYISRFELDFF